MENIQKPKVGAWIKTLCILQLISYVFSLTSIKNFYKIDELNAANNEVNKALNGALQVPEITKLSLTIGLVLAIIFIISIILILMKKELGVYIYFTASVASIVYSIASNGFKLIMLIALIMPVLMGIFIWKKKEVFGLGAEAKNVSS
jgi:Na+/H+ antiporter NhaC